MRLSAFSGRILAVWIMVLAGITGYGQNPTTCASIGQRANSNGGANSCPNNGGAYASNFTNTAYLTVPSSAKTGNVQLTYAGANTNLTPYAITKVWLTTTGTSVQAVSFGPASPPVVSGGNTQVNYCFYGTNLPTAGTLSFQMTDPQTGIVASICSFDASCNTNCTVVANPVTLPIKLTAFTAVARNNGTVALQWTTAQEENNKGFEIERSAGDSVFTPVAFIPTSNTGGNSHLPTTYQYTDRGFSGLTRIAYRLRQEDLDGTVTYSEIALVNVTAAGSAPAVYAAGNAVRINFAAQEDLLPCDILVYNTEGRTVKRVRAVQNGMTSIHDLPEHSVYYIAIQSLHGGQPRMVKAVFVQ